MIRKLSVIIFILCLRGSVVYGQNSVGGFVEMGHNTTMQCIGGVGALVEFPLMEYFTLSGGAYFPLYKEEILKRAVTCNPSIAANGTVHFPLRYRGELFLENRYLFRSLGAYRVYELNAGLLVGYKSSHFLVTVGMAGCLIASHAYDPADGNRFVSEPFNLLYSVEAYLWGRSARRWDVGLRLSNYRAFKVSHSSDPCYSVMGRYILSEQLKLLVDVGVHPSGVFNMNAHYYESYFNIGVTYKW